MKAENQTSNCQGRQADMEIENQKSTWKIHKAYSYLQNAEKIFHELDILNAKVEGDFYALNEFCNDMILKFNDLNSDEFDII